MKGLRRTLLASLVKVRFENKANIVESLRVRISKRVLEKRRVGWDYVFSFIFLLEFN